MTPYYKAGTTNNTVVKSFSGQYGTSPAALVNPPALPTRPPPLLSPAVSAPRDQPFSSTPPPVGFPVPLVLIAPSIFPTSSPIDSIYHSPRAASDFPTSPWPIPRAGFLMSFLDNV